MIKLELKNQLGRTWEKLLLEYFEDEIRAPSSAKHLLANLFVRTAGQLMFTWSLAGVALEALTSYDKLKLGDKILHVYRMLTQHIARDNSGLSLARRKDATCFLRWIKSVIPDATIQECYQSAAGGKALEKWVSSVILNVYQSIGVEKEDGSRQSLENHAKLDETRRFSNEKIAESYDVNHWQKTTRDPRSEGSISTCTV